MLKIINDRIEELKKEYHEETDFEIRNIIFQKQLEYGKILNEYHRKYDLLMPEEKEYLSTVIKPIKKFVKAIYIHKYDSRDNLDELSVYYEVENNIPEYVENNLPEQFEVFLPIVRGTFNKLEEDKEYTLEDLDLED